MGWENGRPVPISNPDDAVAHKETGGAALIVVRRIVGMLLSDSNPSLGIECVALVTGIGYDGSSIAQIARRHCVTRQAVSKRCGELCESFGVPPVAAMRSKKTRLKCRESRFLSLTKG